VQRKRSRFTKFIGLDLGGGKGKKTALAVLELNDVGVAVTRLGPRAGELPLYDARLVDLVLDAAAGGEALLCVDAPLSLPPCLRCEVPVCPGQEACVDPAVVAMRGLADGVGPDRDGRRGKPQVTPYTQRTTEVYLHRRLGVLPRETLGQGMGPLTARASHLLRRLGDRFRLNDNVIEVYPKATLALLRLGDRYKKRVDARLEVLRQLGHLTFAPGVWREACVQSDHVFDALVCAYTGYLFQKDRWRIPEPLAAVAAVDGWIWTPPSPDAAEETSAALPLEPQRQSLP
jgi:predicted nuclease with RNAse H fold